MNHIKSINEFFGLFKKKESPIKIAMDDIRDLIVDDLDNFKYELFECYYESKGEDPSDTEPRVRKSFHVGEKAKSEVDVIGDGPGRRDTRSAVWKYDYKKGICLYISAEDYYSNPVNGLDVVGITREKVLNEVLGSLNKERLSSFGIRFKLVESYVPLILFYAK